MPACGKVWDRVGQFSRSLTVPHVFISRAFIAEQLQKVHCDVLSLVSGER